MTPALAARAFLVMSAFFAYGYAANPCAPAAPASLPATPQSVRSAPTESNRT